MAEEGRPGVDEKYCSSCGGIVKKEAEICVKCGIRLGGGQGKDWLTALLLCLFLGYMGIHRFYTGSTAIGVAQLFTFGGCGIWVFIDFILIIAGSYKDGNGELLVKR